MTRYHTIQYNPDFQKKSALQKKPESKLPIGKVVCVGRNYAEHAAELNNPVPTTPLLFMKPSTAVVDLNTPFAIPSNRGACHHETEIAILIGSTLTAVEAQDVPAAIAGIGVALDLTLRDVQAELKKQGYPWEVAKAFDGSCPLSHFAPYDAATDLTNLKIRLSVNGIIKQQGCASEMITPIQPLIAYISQIFTLLPGDVVLTGTPKGVGPLQHGDQLKVELIDFVTCSSSVL